MEYTIDLKGVKTIWALHEAIKKGLMLPDYYGMNMDALWDCLTGDIEVPSEIHIKSIKSLPKELNETGATLVQLLYDAKAWYKDIDIELKIIESDK